MSAVRRLGWSVPSPAEKSDVARAHRSPWRVFWIAFALAFAILGAWAFASPHMASPDEPAHAAKAAATVRGQFVADESDFRAGRGNFELPALFEQAWQQTCYAFKPDVPAGCVPVIGGDLDEIVPVQSHVARYNPVYYAWIGIPTLFPLSELTFTAMRLMSALLNAALIGFTFLVLAQLRKPFLPIVGVLAAMTPMTLFIGGSMTPQGTEIFGSLLVAVTLASLVFDPRPHLLVSRAWLLVIGTAAFVLTRGLSPAYLLFIIVAILAVTPRLSTVTGILTDRRFWVPLGICAGLSVTAVGYTLLSGSLALGVVYPDPSLTARKVVVTMLYNTDYYLEQILGTFGWGDVHLPVWVLILIGGTALFIGILGFAFGGWRGRLVLAGIVLAAIVVPIGAQLASYHDSGLVWQGKYVLPIAMLAPVLAGFLANRAELDSTVTGALLRTVAALVVGYQTIAVAVNLHRYINGASGPWFETVPGCVDAAHPRLARGRGRRRRRHRGGDPAGAVHQVRSLRRPLDGRAGAGQRVTCCGAGCER